MLVKMLRELDEKTFRVPDSSADFQKFGKRILQFEHFWVYRHRDLQFMCNCVVFTFLHLTSSINFPIPDSYKYIDWS